MTKCLIVTYGYFGDIFFQTSIAKKLKKENRFDQVDYLIGFPQIFRLLKNNPYIDNVLLTNSPTPFPRLDGNLHYDNIYKMKQFSFVEPPTIECQGWAGIVDKSPEFNIYTDPEYDKIANENISELKKQNNKPVVAIPADWKERTFLFTEEEYKLGIDHPNQTGYSGKRRNVEYIKEKLSKHLNILIVGLPMEIKQTMTVNVPENDQNSILFQCSILKACDLFIGSESGMCNMASGVGTRTIISGDFVHQLYGWNGALRKIKEPKLGPVHYFKDKKHIELNPFLTDDEVVTEILKNI